MSAADGTLLVRLVCRAELKANLSSAALEKAVAIIGELWNERRASICGGPGAGQFPARDPTKPDGWLQSVPAICVKQ